MIKKRYYNFNLYKDTVIYMKRFLHSPLKRPLAFPILLMCVIVFLLYTIIDTAIVYKSIPLWIVLMSSVVCLLAIACIARFYFIKYEYILVGDELVVRQYTLRRVIPINSYSLSLIKSIDRISLLHKKGHRAKKYNMCNSLYSSLFSGLVMTYIDSNSAERQKILIDPPEDVKRLLKLNLEDRFHVAIKK